MEATRKGNNTDAMAGLAPVVDRVAASAHEAVDKAARRPLPPPSWWKSEASS